MRFLCLNTSNQDCVNDDNEFVAGLLGLVPAQLYAVVTFSSVRARFGLRCFVFGRSD